MVLDVIRVASEHLTAEQVYSLVLEKMPSIVRATIYNSLNYLEKKELIRRIKMVGEPDHFDKNLHFHSHIICDICKKVEDIDIPDIKADIEKKYDINLTFCEVNLRYICNDCQKNCFNN